jgi:hypothetical protein
MSSQLKSDTARINGAKSRGPVTPEGKTRSSANSRRHGLAAAAVLLDGESAEHFQLLLADHMDQFHPQTGVETDLVEVMAVARWRLRRLLAIEAQLLDLEMVRSEEEIEEKLDGMDHDDRLAFVFQKLSDTSNSLTLLIRYEASINRSYDKAFKQLQQIQSRRPSVPPPTSVGSFSNPEPNQEPATQAGPDVTPSSPESRMQDTSGTLMTCPLPQSDAASAHPLEPGARRKQ